MKRYLLIDGMSIGHAANNGSILKVGQTEVQAIFGFVRTLHKHMRTYASHTPIVLWDGASWRKLKFEGYKEGREKNDTAAEQKVQLAKDSFKKQLPALKKATELLGLDQVHSFNMEADDLAAIMTDRYVAAGNTVTLMTGDKDWIQLVGPGVVWIDPINDRKVTLKNFEEFTGCVDVRQFVEMKCLMGDSGDSVPGVGGIGDKGALEFLKTYGSLANFSNGLLDGTIDPKKVVKKYRDLQNEDKRIAFMRNLMLMDLRTKERPEPINLKITRGTSDRARFEAFCERFMFRTILHDLDGWLEAFPAYQPPWEQAA